MNSIKTCKSNKIIADIVDWRRLYNEELHNYNLYATPNIIRVIKSRRMSWEGHIWRMVEMRNVYKILVRKP